MRSKPATKAFKKKQSKPVRAPRGTARRQALRLSTFMADLDACKTLRQGWDGADAPRPLQTALLRAHEFVLAALHAGLPIERVAASVVGGIGVTFTREKTDAYVEFYNNGTAYLLLAKGRGEPEISPIDEDSSTFPQTLAMIRMHIDA